MNNFERNIYELLFAQKIDFFTRSINNENSQSRNQKIQLENLNQTTKQIIVDTDTPLDIAEKDQPSWDVKESKKLSQKAKKRIAVVTVILFLISLIVGYFFYSNTNDNEQIVLYKVNSETGKRINNMKYFIDSNTKGFVVSNKQVNIQTALDEFIKNFDRSELDLDVNSIPYINLVSDDLKKQFLDNEKTINNWLKQIEEIRYQEKNNIEEFTNAKQKSTTAEQNSNLVGFYKSHGVFDLVVNSNKLYKDNKEVFETIGDISLSENNLTSISFDRLSPSQYINYDNLITNVKSYTNDKYHNQKLITSNDVKVVTENELKDFDQNLENQNVSEIISKYSLNVNNTNLENFASDFEKLKDELRKVTKVSANTDNDLNKHIQDQKFVAKIKELFGKFDHNADAKYCEKLIKTTIDKLNINPEQKNKALENVTKQCNDLAKEHETSNPKLSLNVPGILDTVSSKMYQSDGNSNNAISLVLFDSTKSAKNFLDDYNKKITEAKKHKNSEFSVSSILYNNSNMIVMIPTQINEEITKYLEQVQITNWTYYDYYEQMMEVKNSNQDSNN